jgi:formylmethanofuran dehydrogenase subunit A
MGLHPLGRGDLKGASVITDRGTLAMTNGADKHDDRGGKKKAAGEKPKPRDPRAELKKKNMLPKGIAPVKGQ